MQEGSPTRTSQASVSAALAVANAAALAAMNSGAHFPAENTGQSLADMAYRDLDATLQLLADRAQYITGSTGAAIALRRIGKNDMLCRASSGSNAPELGALLSAEVGLSGESVRTRQPLRCDDTERDARVNREVCRKMGIASVVVMPVVHDDEVLGVFELFSGRVNAFGERDLSALQRLSEMVETAIKLAHAAVEPAGRWNQSEPAADTANRDLADEPILEVEGIDVSSEPDLRVPAETAAVARPVPATPVPAIQVEAGVQSEGLSQVESREVAGAQALPLQQAHVRGPEVQSGNQDQPASTARKPIFWSAAAVTPATQRPAEADQSHVPPTMRSLRKCDACGFPVSAGRMLCVECEEKKWRGQLRPKPKVEPKQDSAVVPDALAAASPTTVRAFAAAAQSAVAAGAGSSSAISNAAPMANIVPASQTAVSKATTKSGHDTAGSAIAVSPTPKKPSASVSNIIPTVALNSAPAAPQHDGPVRVPELVFSAGLAPSESWFSANKYIVGTLLLVGAAIAAVLLLR